MTQIKLPSKQQQLIDIIEAYVCALDEPIHYKLLTQSLIDSGAWIPYGDKPDQILYSAIHQDLRRNGDKSVFRIIKGGLICMALRHIISPVEDRVLTVQPFAPKVIDPAKQRSHENTADVERRLKHLEADATCGNCEHLTLSGPNEYSLEIGECLMYPKSGRHCAKLSAEPCPCWKRAPISQMESRLKRKEELRIWLIKNGFVTISDKELDAVKGKK